VDEVKTGKLAGAVGTYAHLSPELEAQALGKLGLRPETVPTQIVQRDRHAAYLCALALVAAAVERLALTVRHWQRTEVREVEEPFARASAAPRRCRTSATRSSPRTSAGCRASCALRGDGAGERGAVARAGHQPFVGGAGVAGRRLLAGRLHAAARGGPGAGLVVHEDRIKANLESTRGLVYSEGLLLALVDAGTPRQEAYGYVQKAAMRVWDEGLAFADAVRARPRSASGCRPRCSTSCSTRRTCCATRA